MLRSSVTDAEKQLFQQLRYNFPDERIMRRFEIPKSLHKPWLAGIFSKSIQETTPFDIRA